MPNESDVEIVFNFYDSSGDGLIDYKEFIRAFRASNDAEFNYERPKQIQKPRPQVNQKQVEIDVMMGLFRDKIKSRGPRGIIGLLRIFHKMDDDGSGMLSMGEFEKACRDFRIGITPEFMPVVFDAFDINHDGTLSTEEFMKGICGDFPSIRQQTVEMAFQNIDSQRRGFVTMSDLRDGFKAAQHPDVLRSDRTAD